MHNIKSGDKTYIFLILGIASTCSCVAFVGMGFVVSLYTIMLIIAITKLLTEPKRSFGILMNNTSKHFFYLTVFGIISSLFGVIFFINNDEWVYASISGIPKIILYFIFFLLLVKSAKRQLYVHALLKGLIFGVIINAAWASIDAIVYYLSGISITNELFRSYIIAMNTRFEMLSLIIGGVIRSGGLNGDPANIGMFAPILASYSLYSKKYLLYGLAILSIFSSVSIVGLASTLIITLIYLFSNAKAMIMGVAVASLLILGGVYLYNNGNEASNQMISAVVGRLEEKSESNVDDRDNARAVYWTKFFPAVFNTPTAFIIGTGYNTASYAYINGGYIDRTKPYDPEQTYFASYFDLGLIGFFFFLSLHINILRKSYRRKRDNDYLMVFAGMEGIMISFMGYHYTLYSVSMLFLIAGIIMISTTKPIKTIKYI